MFQGYVSNAEELEGDSWLAGLLAGDHDLHEQLSDAGRRAQPACWAAAQASTRWTWESESSELWIAAVGNRFKVSDPVISVQHVNMNSESKQVCFRLCNIFVMYNVINGIEKGKNMLWCSGRCVSNVEDYITLPEAHDYKQVPGK